MGIGPFHKSSFYKNPESRNIDISKGNPDPLNFTIKAQYIFETEVCMLVVNYPDVRNFEGNKVLVYKSAAEVAYHIKKYKQLDPHFSETYLSPLARFVPTEEGIKMAIAFAKTIKL